MNHYRGDDHSWMQTASGKQFWPLDPHPDDVDIKDIAHALAMKCRYAGHCLDFYSVAQHSVLVSRLLLETNPEFALWGLLHDAAEAYTADVIRPIKKHLEQFHEIEAGVMAAIALKFGLEMPLCTDWPCVKTADNILLATERRDLMSAPPRPWKDYGVKPLRSKINPWSWEEAKTRFLLEYVMLTGKGA